MQVILRITDTGSAYAFLNGKTIESRYAFAAIFEHGLKLVKTETLEYEVNNYYEQPNSGRNLNTMKGLVVGKS